MERNHPYLEVLETVTVISWFLGIKERDLFIVRQIQSLFIFLLKERNFRAL